MAEPEAWTKKLEIEGFRKMRQMARDYLSKAVSPLAEQERTGSNHHLADRFGQHAGGLTFDVDVAKKELNRRNAVTSPRVSWLSFAISIVSLIITAMRAGG